MLWQQIPKSEIRVEWLKFRFLTYAVGKFRIFNKQSSQIQWTTFLFGKCFIYIRERSRRRIHYIDATWAPWRHNVSNHRQFHCLLNSLLKLRTKKISKIRITGPLWGEQTLTGGFPSQRASDSKSITMSWRHHVPTEMSTVALSSWRVWMKTNQKFA